MSDVRRCEFCDVVGSIWVKPTTPREVAARKTYCSTTCRDAAEVREALTPPPRVMFEDFVGEVQDIRFTAKFTDLSTYDPWEET